MSEATTAMSEEVVVNESAAVSPSSIINERLKAVERPAVIDQETTFYFKAPRKDAITGKVPEDETGQPIKARPPLKLMLPIPTWDGVLDFITESDENPKYKSFIINTFADLIRNKVRDQVNDDNSPVKRQEDLRIDGLTLKALAEEEPSERAGRGILKETWAAFEQDYISVMGPVTGRSEDKIAGAAKFLSARLYPIRMNKRIVEFLEGQLDLWYQHTTNREEFSELYLFLMKKADDYKNMMEDKLLENLE